MDKLKSMAIFVKIAELGSLTAAADDVGMALPSVVRILATLEDELQVRLFNRTTRNIALTEEGRIYLERSRQILADIEETELLLNQNQLQTNGSITITAPVRFGEMHVAPAITRFLKHYPQIQVNLLLLDRVVNLVEEGIDLAVRISQLGDSSLIAKPLGAIHQVVCASPDLLEKVGIPQHPEELSNLPCIMFTGISTGSIWPFIDKEKSISIKIHGSFSTNQVSSAVNACISGLGFGKFYSYQVMPAIRNGELKQVLTDYQSPAIPINLVYSHTRLMTSRVRVCINWLNEELISVLN